MTKRNFPQRGFEARFHGRHPGPFGPGFGADFARGFAGFGPGFGPGPRHGGRARRGDVRIAILGLLAEQPNSGYGLIKQFPERTDGVWRVSPGSVYPTLQQLVDEGLVEQDGGQYRLTEAGSAFAAEQAEQIAAAWKVADEATLTEAHEYRQAAHKLLRAIGQLGSDGTAAQRAAAIEKIDELRKALYLILAD